MQEQTLFSTGRAERYMSQISYRMPKKAKGCRPLSASAFDRPAGEIANRCGTFRHLEGRRGQCRNMDVNNRPMWVCLTHRRVEPRWSLPRVVWTFGAGD